eukprot:SAG22_NODE_4461_length_1261_cov_1.422547_1_plen_384_part_00
MLYLQCRPSIAHRPRRPAHPPPPPPPCSGPLAAGRWPSFVSIAPVMPLLLLLITAIFNCGISIVIGIESDDSSGSNGSSSGAGGGGGGSSGGADAGVLLDRRPVGTNVSAAVAAAGAASPASVATLAPVAGGKFDKLYGGQQAISKPHTVSLNGGSEYSFGPVTKLQLKLDDDGGVFVPPVVSPLPRSRPEGPRPEGPPLDFAVSVSLSREADGLFAPASATNPNGCRPQSDTQPSSCEPGDQNCCRTPAGFPGTRDPQGPLGPLLTLNDRVARFAFRTKDAGFAVTNVQQECPGHGWENRPCPLSGASGDHAELAAAGLSGEKQQEWGDSHRNVTTITLPRYINYPILNESSTVYNKGMRLWLTQFFDRYDTILVIRPRDLT